MSDRTSTGLPFTPTQATVPAKTVAILNKVKSAVATYGVQAIFDKCAESYDINTNKVGKADVAEFDQYTAQVSPPSRVKERIQDENTPSDRYITTKDMQIMLPNDSLEFTPEISDRVTIAGVEYKIADVEEIHIGDFLLVYKIRLAL